MELYLYIIWNTAYKKRDEILDDINSTFKVHKVLEVEWTQEKFMKNISRFYGKKVKKVKFKEKACGNAPFTLVIVEDVMPVYGYRLTSRGDQEYVNLKVFDKKALYREWTQKQGEYHFKIHGSNSAEETEHDLMLLLGMNQQTFLEKKDELGSYIKQDLVGENGWDSLEQLFEVLNSTCRYSVLRNFEGLPQSFYLEGHDDIDILVEDFENTVGLANALGVHKNKNRVQCTCNVNGEEILIDFRYIGDGYYDKSWEEDIIETRVKKNGIYIPSDENYKYMVLYHALLHKIKVSKDYEERLNILFGKQMWDIEVLKKFLKEKKYVITEPKDLSVYLNTIYILNVKISFMRNIKIRSIYLKKYIKRCVTQCLSIFAIY